MVRINTYSEIKTLKELIQGKGEGKSQGKGEDQGKGKG